MSCAGRSATRRLLRCSANRRAPRLSLHCAVGVSRTAAVHRNASPSGAAGRLGRETSNLDALCALAEGRLQLEGLDRGAVNAAIGNFDRAAGTLYANAFSVAALNDSGFALLHMDRLEDADHTFVGP